MLDHFGSSGMPGSSSSDPPTAVDGASLGSLVWGSIERNTGTFCPYAETAEIEAAFARVDASIHLPGCFNATLHFRRDTLHHYQLTPAVGSKPAGFRSVVRGAAGDRVDIFWHPAERLFRTEPPAAVDRQLVVELTPVPPPATHWQWCDLVGQAAASARECNWHSYDESVSGEIEGAWSARRPSLRFVIGLSEYEVRDFNGSYATQHNLATGGSGWCAAAASTRAPRSTPASSTRAVRCAPSASPTRRSGPFTRHRAATRSTSPASSTSSAAAAPPAARSAAARCRTPAAARRRRSSRWRRWRRRTAVAAVRWTTGGMDGAKGNGTGWIDSLVCDDA